MNSINFKPKVLHLLNKSFPEYVGYTIRSHYILFHQKKFAHPYALTRPFFIRKNEADFFETVIYIRYPRNFGKEVVHKLCYYHPKIIKYYNLVYYSYLQIPKKFIEKIVIKKDIDLIHGHTPYIFSSLGEKVAHKNRIPFVYEVRGLWEDTNVILGLYKENDSKYLEMRQQETDLMKKADAVITLGNLMKKELINRGIEKDKLYVIPNAVDIESFQPIPSDMKLKKTFEIENKHIIAYIGSIREIEGIETLIKTISVVRNELKDIILLLVGGYDRRYYVKLQNLIKKLSLDQVVLFTGNVPPSEINRYYSIADIIVIPRINSRLNRIVTPLKQFEAMAMKKVVIASDLPALREVIKPGISGDLFEPEDINELAKKILYYLTNQKERNKLGDSARNFVKENYDWNIVIDKYRFLYENLLKKPIIY